MLSGCQRGKLAKFQTVNTESESWVVGRVRRGRGVVSARCFLRHALLCVNRWAKSLAYKSTRCEDDPCWTMLGEVLDPCRSPFAVIARSSRRHVWCCASRSVFSVIWCTVRFADCFEIPRRLITKQSVPNKRLTKTVFKTIPIITLKTA